MKIQSNSNSNNNSLMFIQYLFLETRKRLKNAIISFNCLDLNNGGLASCHCQVNLDN